MEIKSGVIMPNKLEMRKALIAADQLWQDFGQDLVVTSGTEGTHSPGSLHYSGYALDLRTRYFKTETSVGLMKALQARLGSKYYVKWHESHLHVGYNHILEAEETA